VDRTDRALRFLLRILVWVLVLEAMYVLLILTLALGWLW
jgi:hypothetical protein